MDSWSLTDFCDYVKCHDWKIKKFTRDDRTFICVEKVDFTFVFQVHDKKVSIEYVKRFKETVERIEQKRKAPERPL